MLIDEYKALSARNDFFLDAEQEKAINKFQELYNKIIGLKGSSNSILGNIGLNLFNSSSKKTGKGIYLHGGVGIGKTFIMDMFYKELPINNKKRIHFHRFMNDIHEKLNKIKNIENPIDLVANEISNDIQVLCLDEFIINDIADAMKKDRNMKPFVQRFVKDAEKTLNPKKSLEKDFATNVMAAAKKIISKEISSSNHEETINKSLEDFRK